MSRVFRWNELLGVGKSRRDRLCLAALGVVLLFAALTRFPFIHGTAPYPRHPDERITVSFIAFAARAGNLDPGNFLYPGLARYIAALTGYVGFLSQKLQGHIHHLTELEEQCWPHYRHPEVFWVTKYVWAAFSLVTLVNVGVLARKLTGSAIALVLAPALLCISERFLYSSREYVNVDILSAMIITSAMVFLVSTWERRTWLHTAIVPGVFVGLAAGAKYPHGALMLPFVLAAFRWWPEKRRVLACWGGLGASSALAFWACNPYLPFRFHQFLHDLDVQRRAYGKGWPGTEITPGWPHLVAQVREYWADVGWGVWALALAGIVWLIATHRFKGVTVVSHCLAFFAYFITMRSNIPRTLLPCDAMMAAFAAIGAIGFVRLAGSSRVRFATPRVRGWVAGLAVAGVVLSSAPWSQIAKEYARKPESRNRAVAWILANVPQGSTLHIERTLDLDTGPLEGKYQLHWLDLSKMRYTLAEKKSLASLQGYFLIPVFGADPRLHAAVRLASRLNRELSPSENVARFEGWSDIWLGYSRNLPHGDPRFSIYRHLTVR